MKRAKIPSESLWGKGRTSRGGCDFVLLLVTCLAAWKELSKAAADALFSPLVLESGLRVLPMLYAEAVCHSALGWFGLYLAFLYGACVQTPVWFWRSEGNSS